MSRLVWTKKDNDFLKSYYHIKTAAWCADRLDRSKNAVHLHASSIGLKASGRRGCRKTRQILRRLYKDIVICFCPRHSQTEHKLYMNGKVRCSLCLKISEDKRKSNRIWTDHTRELSRLARRRQRATPLGKYTNRIRVALRQCSLGRISFSRHLPYKSKQLCEHLEDIRHKQKNRCPTCDRSYNDVQDSIDHIIPVSIASTDDELLSLFALGNLSLLCLNCNSIKGAKI